MSTKFTEYKGLDLPTVASEVLDFWKKENIFEKSVTTREGAEPYVFFEGPPSANGLPGIHPPRCRTNPFVWILGRKLKKTMNVCKSVVLIFTLFLIISCEKFYIASIVNNSKNKITVKIKIDNDAVDKKRKEYLEQGFLFPEDNPKDYQITIDTSASYDIEGSMHVKPDFYEIKEMEIYSGDTLILKCRKDQMEKLFSAEGARSPGFLDLIIY